MRQLVVVAGDLSENCRCGRIKREVLVFYKEATNTTEVDAAEEVMQVNVEYKSASHVHPRICHDRVVPLESVRYAVMFVVFNMTMVSVDFVDAVLQQISKAVLNEFEVFIGGTDFATTTVFFGDLELCVTRCYWLFVKHEREHSRLYIEQVGYMAKSRCRLQSF